MRRPGLELDFSLSNTAPAASPQHMLFLKACVTVSWQEKVNLKSAHSAEAAWHRSPGMLEPLWGAGNGPRLLGMMVWSERQGGLSAGSATCVWRGWCGGKRDATGMWWEWSGEELRMQWGCSRGAVEFQQECNGNEVGM